MSLPWNPHSAGGKACAAIQKEQAAERYKNNPVVCKNCNKLIEPNGRKFGEVRRTKFCNRSCAAKFHNRKRLKIKTSRCYVRTCEKCGIPITGRKYCKSCWLADGLGLRTKGDIFKNRVNWQSARSSIRHHAVLTWLRFGNKLVCSVCGYNKHAEVAHKKAVSDFSDDATVQEINAIDNLIALCPNHHWEFDNLSHDSETESCGSHTPEFSVQL